MHVRALVLQARIVCLVIVIVAFVLFLSSYLDSKLSEQAFEKDLRDQTLSLAQELATGIGVRQIIGTPEVLQQEIEVFGRMCRDLQGLEVFLASPQGPVLAALPPGSSPAVPVPAVWDRTLKGQVSTSLERSRGTRIWKVTAPITRQGSVLGAVQAKSSLESTNRLAARERRQSLSIMTAASVVTVGAFSEAFGVSIATYQYWGGTYRGRVGAVHVPAELAEIVQGGFGLDDRPQAKPHFRLLKETAAVGASLRSHIS